MIVNKKRFISFIAILSLTLIFPQSPASALFGPSSGDKCSVKDERKKLGGKAHICSQSKDGINRWLINTTPTDKDAALGLVLENCGSDYDGKYSVYIFPRMIFGAVIQKTIESGRYTPDKKSQSIFNYEINRSRLITGNFEMASTLDSKWIKINNSWNGAIDSAFKRWTAGGVTQLEASIAAESALNSVESICKVASKNGLSAANKEKRTILAWIARVTSGF